MLPGAAELEEELAQLHRPVANMLASSKMAIHFFTKNTPFHFSIFCRLCKFKNSSGIFKIDFFFFFRSNSNSLNILNLRADIAEGDIASKQDFSGATLCYGRAEYIEKLIHVSNVDIDII